MDPQTGRFVSEDPYEGGIEGPVSLHRYLYANSGPVNGVDPSGRMTLGEMNVALNIAGILTSLAVDGYKIKTGTAESNNNAVDFLAIIDANMTAIEQYMAFVYWKHKAGQRLGEISLNVRPPVFKKALEGFSLSAKGVSVFGAGMASLDQGDPTPLITEGVKILVSESFEFVTKKVRFRGVMGFVASAVIDLAIKPLVVEKVIPWAVGEMTKEL